MVNKRTLFFLICLIPCSLAAQNPSNITGDRFEETAGNGLAVRTNPAGVKVFIDGVERGTTPVSLSNLQPGDYSVRLSKEGYKERVFNVTLFSASRLVVSIKMEEERGRAFVSVYRAPESPAYLPFSPQVLISALDDILETETLPDEHKAVLSMPVGFRIIRARAFGWEDTSVSALISESEDANVNIQMKPAPFAVTNAVQSRKQINPLNPGRLGSNEYRFEVSAPGSGAIIITNDGGAVVFQKKLDEFETWNQQISWNGRDSSDNALPEGAYSVFIEVLSYAAEIFTIVFTTEVTYAGNIFPLSFESGSPGLTFSPIPHVLPARRYQFDAGILFGSFYLKEKSTFSLPLEINMRISPFKKFELAASVNIIPYFANKTQAASAGWGISGSVKYNIIDGSSIPLLFSAGISYKWASASGELPLSPGKGIGLHAPLSAELANFSLVFSPGIFWHGPDSPAPLLLLSTGALYKGAKLNAGLSARCEMDFTEKPLTPKFLTGAEFSFVPSNLFFLFSAGIIYHEKHLGWYGGFRIGIIN